MSAKNNPRRSAALVASVSALLASAGAIALVKKGGFDLPLQFTNFRD